MSKPNNEDVLSAILGAAILGGLADQVKEAPTEKKGEALKRAEDLRRVYDAFIEVGFTEDQATAFVCAILN